MIDDVMAFRLKISDPLKKFKTKLNKDKLIKEIKILEYQENGRMIHIKKDVLNSIS